jgi:hypothetical protein
MLCGTGMSEWRDSCGTAVRGLSCSPFFHLGLGQLSTFLSSLSLRLLSLSQKVHHPIQMGETNDNTNMN